jgi:hypothetical protein
MRFGRALLVLVVLAAVAHADGKVLGRAVAKVSMPDQAALLHFADGRETLVIEPAFVGEGEEFAWLVPLPLVPEVAPATRGLFPTLHSLFLPEVIAAESSLFAVVLPIWLLSLIAAGIHWRDRHKVAMHWFLLIVVLPFLLLCFASLVIIASTTLRSAALKGGTMVHAREIVGSYETLTLSGEAVPQWLEANGYRVPAEAAPVLEEYASEGWVIFAAKLRVDAATGREHRAHPLRFDFESERAIYPLRLTGTGGEPLLLDLYVFGERRANAAGMEVERASDSIPVVHPGLMEIVGDAPFATKLRGTLSPEAMRRDLEIRWSDDGEHNPVYYTVRAAKSLAANTLLACVAIGTAILAWVVAVGRIGRMGVLVSLAATALLAVLVAMGVRELLPVRDAKYERVPTEWIHWRHIAALESEYEVWEGIGIERARERLVEVLGEEFVAAEQDSPGHYVLRERDGGIEFVTFDRFGEPRPHRLGSNE